MTTSGSCPFSSRRGFLAAAGLAGTIGAARAFERAAPPSATPATEPFWGEHQAGILTTRQTHTYFAAFDLLTAERADLAALLARWTDAAARMTQGEQAAGASDTALGLSPARLTLTFGFGPGLFVRDGHDRFGLADHRPEALVDLPRFNGDQLEPARTGGDISVQACADDPQIAFNAVRELYRLAGPAAQIRWVQTGFCGNEAAGQTGRNLMGFKDGTLNPGPTAAERDTAEVVWAGPEGPAWMRGGSYLVARRIRIALEHWDRSPVDYQEQVIGRSKRSGAPLGARREFDALDLRATDKDGNELIPDDAHARLASAAANDGARILRRAYSYNDGAGMTVERWPPWRQGIELDAGLFFLAYQRDPRSGFIKIFDRMSKLDALNQFTTHTGGGIFACPPGVAQGRSIGDGLLGV